MGRKLSRPDVFYFFFHLTFLKTILSSRTFGTFCFARAKQNKPDVILCDIRMPEADGYEVINKLKNDIATAHIPFIFLTASFEKRDETASYAMGASGYIQNLLTQKNYLLPLKSVLLQNAF